MGTLIVSGNLTARGTDGFTYDQANRLVSSSVASGGTAAYTYDGDGKRIQRIVGTTTYTYLYDDDSSMPVILEDGLRRNVWGNDLASAIDIQYLSAAAARKAAGMAAPASAPGEILVYHTDGLGSVRVVTDAYGNVTQVYQTDEFGVPAASVGSITQPFGYTGEQRDANPADTFSLMTCSTS